MLAIVIVLLFIEAERMIYLPLLSIADWSNWKDTEGHTANRTPTFFLGDLAKQCGNDLSEQDGCLQEEKCVFAHKIRSEL